MKKYLTAAVSAAAFASSAFAAELSSIKSAPTASATPIWTGFYAGINAGYGFGTSDNAQNIGWGNPSYFNTAQRQLMWFGAGSTVGAGINQAGYIGGAQVGYNLQPLEKFVLGFETDIQGAGIRGNGSSIGSAPSADSTGSIPYTVVNGNFIQSGIDWMGTARGRIGYLMTPSVLFYGTGGLSYGGTFLKTYPLYNAGGYGGQPRVVQFNTISSHNQAESLNVGWTAGGGFEWMFAQNWSIKGEALYYDLGSIAVSNSAIDMTNTSGKRGSLSNGQTTRAYYQGVIARAGINYHFGWHNMSTAFQAPRLFDENDLPNSKKSHQDFAWSGLYAGINAGYGIGTSSNAQNYGWGNPAFFDGNNISTAGFAAANSWLGRNVSQGGFIGGGGLGYNIKYLDKIIVGAEVDIQGSGIRGVGDANGLAPYPLTAQSAMFKDSVIQAGVDWMGTARGRIGYLIGSNLLLYGTGGLAYGDAYIKSFSTNGIAGRDTGFGPEAYTLNYVNTQPQKTSTLVGWTAGGGSEWMFTPNWSLKAEALYYNLGSLAVTTDYYYADPVLAANNPVGGSTTRAYYQGIIARGGINYHFNLSSDPVVAKF